MATALIVVDVQNDFCEGGSLAVAGGKSVAADIADYVARTADDYVVTTQDWHIDPGDHFSSDPDYTTSWPVHCRANSSGADFAPEFAQALDSVDAAFLKGQHSDGYSGFDGESAAGGQPLAQWLREHDVTHVSVCGIAADYCVRATALSAVREGFEVRVLADLTAGVNPTTTQAAFAELAQAGAAVETSR